jgi:hypothetical protein
VREVGRRADGASAVRRIHEEARLPLALRSILQARLQNRAQEDAVILEVGTRNRLEGLVHYPGIDLLAVVGRAGYAHTDRTPYPEQARRGRT